MDEAVKLDRAYANGMRGVLRAVWPFVKEQDRKLAAVLKELDEAAERRVRPDCGG